MHQRPFERIVGDILFHPLDDFPRQAQPVVKTLLPDKFNPQPGRMIGRPALHIGDKLADLTQRLRRAWPHIHPRMNMIRHHHKAVKDRAARPLRLARDRRRDGLPGGGMNHGFALHTSQQRAARLQGKGQEERRPAAIVIPVVAVMATGVWREEHSD